MSEIVKKIITNFRFDYYLLSASNLSLSSRLSFLIRKYFAIALNKRNIHYLENKFYYDNRFVPAILENYPREIRDLDKAINLSKINSVLDIGANIGQFAVTLKTLHKHLEIHSFEPNPKVYPMLQKNAANFSNLSIHNFGLGNNSGKHTLYFPENASAEGTLIKENVNQNYMHKNAKKISVEIKKLTKQSMKNLKIPSKIDLVKIDVEGFELEVLKSLKEIDFSYLFIEVSVNRTGISLEDIKNFLKNEKKVNAKLVYYYLPDKNSPIANAIFSLKS